MNVQCTHCETVFRVDPAKIPAGGARARCSICRGVFEVPAANADPAAAADSAPAPRPTAAPEPALATPAPAGPRPTAGPAPEAATPPPPAAPAPTPAAPATPASSASARPTGASPFGAADPNAKARRLARALVSDIVTYHPERRDSALAQGTLKREFMEEIKKSWEEYVQQVGMETARGTPHFRDALNDVLAKGGSIF
jgi:predicted Zn finger-like uncharacterized protein